MAELVDALDSGSSRGNSVDVRVILAANMKIALVANGEKSTTAFLSQKLSEFDEVIAVDGGIHSLIELDIAPIALIGDFDSSTLESHTFFKNKLLKFPEDKDKSDTALAVEYALSLKASEIVIFNALGGRTDHTLSNLALLTLYPGKLSIETERETVYAIVGFHKQFSRSGQTVSLFSLGEKAEGVTTQGLKWNLQDETVDSKFFSLSNRVLGDSFDVSIRTGTLICVIQNG